MAAPLAKPGVSPGGAHVSKRARRGRSPWAIAASLGALIGAAALIAISLALLPGGASKTAAGSGSELAPTGTIAQSDQDFCRRLRFDDAGRVFQDVVPCGGTSARDAHGQPVPAGTMRRLDAISKSFSGH